MKISNEMVDAGAEAVQREAGSRDTCNYSSISRKRLARGVLEAALADVPEPASKYQEGHRIGYAAGLAEVARRADVPEPVLGPKPDEYSEEQVQAALRAWFVDPRSTDKNGDMRGALAAAGVRTLAAPAVEPLSLEDNRLVESVERTTYVGGDNALIHQLARVIRKHTKKPDPIKRTAEELEQAIINYYGDSYDVPEVVEELIALAKEAKP